MPAVDTFAASDRGLVRATNEDAFLLEVPEDEAVRRDKGLLAIVADGVGGAAGGDKASRMAVAVIRDHYFQSSQRDASRSLVDAVKAANCAIHQAAQREPRYRHMATTCTAAVIKGNQGLIAHVGDSRAYVLRQGRLQQITEDHTLVNKLVKGGLLPPGEAKRHPQKNVIVNALGNRPEIAPDLHQVEFAAHDLVLMCSDGLYDMVPDDELARTLGEHPVKESGRRLIHLAKEGGGHDNITALIFKPVDGTGLMQTRPFLKADEERKRLLWLSPYIALLLFGAVLYFWR